MLLLVDAPAYFAFLAVAVSLGTDYAASKHRLPTDGRLPLHFWYVAILQACAVLFLFLFLRWFITEFSR